MQTAPLSITSASVSTNGGARALRLLLILTIRNGSRTIRIVLYQVALLTNWSCDYANVMEVIAGSWLILSHCGTNRTNYTLVLYRNGHRGIASRLKTGFAQENVALKRADEKIRGQEAELRQMLDLAPQLVAVFGPDHERIYANRIGLDYLGVTLEEWRQTGDMRRFVHPDDGDRMRAFFDRAVAVGSAYELEYRIRKVMKLSLVSGSLQPGARRTGTSHTLVMLP